MAKTFDCIVLGAGGMGSAALYHLARRGVKVLGIERFGVAHDRGSSHGQTRIIRKAYFEHPDYVPLLLRTYELWHQLQDEFGEPLIDLCGLMLAGPPQGETIAGALQAAKLHGLPVETLTAQAARKRFAGFAFSDDMSVVFEADAGYLLVEKCVQAHAELAVRHGAVLQTGETVLRWTSHGGTVTVTTDRGEYAAARLLITPGAWSGALLPDVPIAWEVLRKVLLWFPVRAEAYRRDAGTPGFLYETAEGVFYGFPCLDGATLKLAEHSGGKPVEDPLNADRQLHDDDVAPVARFAERYLAGVAGPPGAHAVCFYTCTPDRHFLVDAYPAAENVHFAAGFSGHGFKFAAVMGEVLADLALQGRTEHPIGFLGGGRFGG